MTPRDESILFVVAASESGARNWARAVDILPDRWRYVHCADVVRGQQAPPVVLVPGWTSFRMPEEEAAIRDSLEAARAYYVDYGALGRLDPWRSSSGRVADQIAFVRSLRPVRSRWTRRSR